MKDGHPAKAGAGAAKDGYPPCAGCAGEFAWRGGNCWYLGCRVSGFRLGVKRRPSGGHARMARSHSSSVAAAYAGCTVAPLSRHPGGNPWANLKSISHRCHPMLVAFVWELTKETIDLPLGCLQGGSIPRRARARGPASALR